MNRTTKRLLYMGTALAMLAYAVPRMNMSGEEALATGFGAVWIAFALIVVASHLYAILRVDEETERRLEKVRMHRRRQLARFIDRRMVKRGGP